MRGGQPHDLVPAGEHTGADRPAKYRCCQCGEVYQVRTSAPSCRLRLLEQMGQLLEPYASLDISTQRALLAELVRRRLKWPRPFRDAMLELFERWHTWPIGHGLDQAGG